MADASGVVVNGGAPIIEGVSYDTADAFSILYVHGGSEAIVRDSDLGGS